MRYLILLLLPMILALSPVPPESVLYLCQWEWKHDFMRMDETVMQPDEMAYYSIFIDGKEIKLLNPTKKDKYFFFTRNTDSCPLKLPVKAVDTVGRESTTIYVKRLIFTQ